MLRYTFLIYHRQYKEFLNQIRSLGVLHVIEKGEGEAQEESPLADMMAQVSRIDRTIKAMEARLVIKEQTLASAGNTPADETLLRYEQLVDQRTKEQQLQASINKEIDRIEVWGDFDIENVLRLEKSGYNLRFFSTPKRLFDPAWIDQYNAIEIAEKGTQLYFVTLTPVGQEVEIENADRIKAPAESLSSLEKELNLSIAREVQTDKEIDQLTVEQINTLKEVKMALTETFEYSKVVLNTSDMADGKLMLLQGWVPKPETEKVNQYLQNEGYYYQISEPTEDDQPPIKLKNNAFARLFEVIGELYDMPNYHEIDLTAFFAPFFVMFFGLCLGDAGYGLLIAIGAFIARFKVKPSMKPLMSLATILGAGTVFFGVISGTFFGIPLLTVNWPWIQSAKAFMMDTDQLFNFALIIGACQIIFGMILKAVGATRRYGFKNALSQWGWLVLILGMGANYGLGTLGYLSPEYTKIGYYVVFGVSAIGIFLFNNIKRNPFINIGAGLWDTYNMATGLMGDLLSYIRLFALGISGSVMGLVFNDLSVKLSGDVPVVSQIVMLIILLLGHGLNIFMNGLGAFVHPMRLTFVEFYKNSGFEGGGVKYRPFASLKKSNNK